MCMVSKHMFVVSRMHIESIKGSRKLRPRGVPM